MVVIAQPRFVILSEALAQSNVSKRERYPPCPCGSETTGYKKGWDICPTLLG